MLELRTEQKTVSLLDNPSVQIAKKRITEIRVPFAALGATNENQIRFRIAVGNETIPQEGWFDIASPA